MTATFVAHAQQSTGTINGIVHDRQSRVEAGVEAQLVELSTGTMVERTAVAPDGRFVFHDVPFARYAVRITYDSLLLAVKGVDLSSSVPITLEISDLSEFALPGVQVVAAHLALTRSQTTSSRLFTAEAIRDLPVASGTKQIEAVLLNTPGVAPDEDGRLHIRGEDAQLQYVIDGIPVTTNLTRVYSSLFDASLIKSADVQTGGMNAEYGVATAGVVALTTKSGFDAPLIAHLSGGYGTYGNREISSELGGNIGGRLGIFVAASSSETDRYLDPVSSGDPIHGEGSTRTYFAKMNGIITEDLELNILGSYNMTDYAVPNSVVKTPAQDQNQELSDYMVGARLNAYIGEQTAISLLGYRRHAEARITSGGLLRISNGGDSARAVAENEKFFIGGERTNEATGGNLEYSTRGNWLDLDHELKAGIGGEEYPLSEFFTFAVTRPGLSDPDSAGGDIRYRPYDLTRGGTPFLVNSSRTGQRFSGFVQDRARFGAWTVSAGLRYDRYALLDTETAISPRLGVAYAWSDNLFLHGSYSRMVMQAPVENILVSSSDEARALTGAEQGSTPINVRSEKANNLEIGARYQLDENLSFELTGYGKLIQDFIVKVELGNSGVIFPVNLKEGLVAGGELRAELHDWNDLSGFLAISGGAALGMKPEDGSSPIAAGLILGEEGRNYSHPFAGEDVFPTEHSQIITAVMNLTYRETSGLFATFGGRFDSGLPFDLTGSNGEGLDAAQSRVELKNRGYSDEVIDLLELESEEPGSPDKSVAPHVIFDLAAGFDFYRLTGFHARVTATALNVLDTPYLYKFESSFGGTHYGVPRTLAVRVEVGL
jgi:outer membrane receptor protein involved in Fe transport